MWLQMLNRQHGNYVPWYFFLLWHEHNRNSDVFFIYIRYSWLPATNWQFIIHFNCLKGWYGLCVTVCFFFVAFFLALFWPLLRCSTCSWLDFLCFILKLNKTIALSVLGLSYALCFSSEKMASFITAAPVNPDKLLYVGCLKGRRRRRLRMHHTQQVTCWNLHAEPLLLLLLLQGICIMFIICVFDCLQWNHMLKKSEKCFFFFHFAPTKNTFSCWKKGKRGRMPLVTFQDDVSQSSARPTVACVCRLSRVLALKTGFGLQPAKEHHPSYTWYKHWCFPSTAAQWLIN